jgi:hypothetical protein
MARAILLYKDSCLIRYALLLMHRPLSTTRQHSASSSNKPGPASHPRRATHPKDRVPSEQTSSTSTIHHSTPSQLLRCRSTTPATSIAATVAGAAPPAPGRPTPVASPPRPPCASNFVGSLAFPRQTSAGRRAGGPGTARDADLG